MAANIPNNNQSIVLLSLNPFHAYKTDSPQKGELYGLEHSPSRFRQRWLRPQTPVQGLFLTGQDITTVGLTGALFSGLLTCSSILKKNLYKEII